MEVTQSRVRRERMGHIALACSVAHVWYFKGAPSKLSLLLDVAPKALESVIYFAQFIVTSVDAKEQAIVLERLQKESQTARAKIKSDTAVKAASPQTEFEHDLKALQASDLNEDAKGLAENQLHLKLKQQTQNLHDSEAAEDQATLALYQRLSDIIKNLKLASILTEDEYFKLNDHKAASFLRSRHGSRSDLGSYYSNRPQQVSLRFASGSYFYHRPTPHQSHQALAGCRRHAPGRGRPGLTILKVLPVIPSRPPSHGSVIRRPFCHVRSQRFVSSGY